MGSRVLCALKKSSILTKFHIRDGLRVARDNHLFYGGSCRSVCGGLGRLRDGQCSFVRSVQISQLQLCSSRGLQDVRQPQTNPPPSLHSTLTINPEEEKAKEEARSNKYFKVYLWSTGILLSATLALLIYINGMFTFNFAMNSELIEAFICSSFQTKQMQGCLFVATALSDGD